MHHSVLIHSVGVGIILANIRSRVPEGRVKTNKQTNSGTICRWGRGGVAAEESMNHVEGRGGAAAERSSNHVVAIMRRLVTK
jgi:hypothetical protein